MKRHAGSVSKDGASPAHKELLFSRSLGVKDDLEFLTDLGIVVKSTSRVMNPENPYEWVYSMQYSRPDGAERLLETTYEVVEGYEEVLESDALAYIARDCGLSKQLSQHRMERYERA